MDVEIEISSDLFYRNSQNVKNNKYIKTLEIYSENTLQLFCASFHSKACRWCHYIVFILFFFSNKIQSIIFGKTAVKQTALCSQ